MKITGTATENIRAGDLIDGETNTAGHLFVRPSPADAREGFAPSIDAEKLAELWRGLTAEIARVKALPDRKPFEEIAGAVMARQLFNEAMFEAFPAILAILRPPIGDVLPSCARMAPITHRFFISQAESDAGEAGFTLTALSNAVQIWSCMQGPQISVAVAARAFNCEPSLIAAAVRDHHWMFLTTKAGHLLDAQDHEAGGSVATSIDDYAAVFIEHEGE